MQLHYEIAETMEKRRGDRRAPGIHRAPLLVGVAAHAGGEGGGCSPRPARAAVARLAYEEGARLYRSAIEVSRALDDERLYVELLLALGDALSRAGATEASKSAFLEASDRLRTLDEAELFGRAALGYGGPFIWLRAGDDTRIVPLLHEAIDQLPGTDSPLRVRLLARLSGAMRDDVSKAPRDVLSREAVEAAQRMNDATFARLRASRALVRDMGARPRRRTPRARGGGDEKRSAVVARPSGRRAVGQRARAPDARRHQPRAPGDRRLFDIGEELNRPSIKWYGTVMSGVLLLSDGHLSQAEETIESARRLGRDVQAWDCEISYRLAVTMLRWEQGLLAEVEASLHEATTRFPGYACSDACLRCATSKPAVRTKRLHSCTRSWRPVRKHCRTTTTGSQG